jgi:phosphatidylinositol glycan class W
VLPLLLGITIFSTSPYLFNAALGCTAYLVYLSKNNPARSHAQPKVQVQVRRSKGSWLAESDSDEEISYPPASTVPSYTTSLKLPSELIPSSPVPSTDANPGSLSPASAEPDSPNHTPRQWRRRHSPTPSTHTHTAINILPTPEAVSSPKMQGGHRSYPQSPTTPTFSPAKEHTGKLPFLSVYRAHMMIMTIHAILAVDFTVFPRWQGKCEDFGTSLVSESGVRPGGRLAELVRWTSASGRSCSLLESSRLDRLRASDSPEAVLSSPCSRLYGNRRLLLRSGWFVYSWSRGQTTL